MAHEQKHDTKLVAVKVEKEKVPMVQMLQSMGITRLSANDLETIKVPTGGATVWTVPSLEGEMSRRDLVGTILHIRSVRRYFSHGYDEMPNQPPDCQSVDMVRGEGKPGGSCDVCPLRDFDCKQRKELIVKLEGQLIPVHISIPSASVSNVTKYLLRLASAGMRYQHVVTELTLSKQANKKGLAYARVELRMVKVLSEAEQDEATGNASFAQLLR